MIHILTVHWKSDYWIDIQFNRIGRATKTPYKSYAFLNGFDAAPHRDKFFYTARHEIADHATKLDILADIACAGADSPDDILVFIDSDAFPVRPWEDFIREKLKTNVLVAVRRDENLGDPQPHPCFCATTVLFWTAHSPSWRAGYSWQNSAGKTVTDVGGNLLGLLNETKLPWHPLLRTNRLNIHPLFYAIYGDIIYHHGCGSRTPFSRLDIDDVARNTNPLLLAALRLVGMRKFFERRRGKEFQQISDEILRQIENNPEFWHAYV